MMDRQCFSLRCFINTIINKPKINYSEQRDSSLTDTETCHFNSALLVEIMIHTCIYVSNHWGESLYTEQKFKNNFMKYYAPTDTKLDMTLKYIFFFINPSLMVEYTVNTGMITVNVHTTSHLDAGILNACDVKVILWQTFFRIFCSSYRICVNSFRPKDPPTTSNWKHIKICNVSCFNPKCWCQGNEEHLLQ